MTSFGRPGDRQPRRGSAPPPTSPSAGAGAEDDGIPSQFIKTQNLYDYRPTENARDMIRRLCRIPGAPDRG